MSVDVIFDSRKKELERKMSENALMERQASKAEDDMVAAAEKMEIATDALSFLEELANSRRGSMKTRIESLLTEALRLVYGMDRSVEISYGIKNNRSSLDFNIVKQTPAGEVRRRLDGSGSGLGVSDTVSVPLRLLVLLGSKQCDRVCVLDECYKHVSVELIPIVTKFLRALNERLGIQIILLSHHEMVREEADAAYGVRESQGVSIVNRK